MSKLAARIKVVATSAVTWLTLLAAGVPLAAEEVAKLLPESAETVTAVAATVVVWLGVAVAIIRLVTTVAKTQRGVLLPPPTAAQRQIAIDAITYLARKGATVDDLEAALLQIRSPSPS
jgi:hypothetical protein